MLTQFLGKIGGRKFILALFGAIAVALHAALGISEAAVMTIGGIVAAYALGQGFADGFSSGATSSLSGTQEEDEQSSDKS